MTHAAERTLLSDPAVLPSWFRQPVPDTQKLSSLKDLFSSTGLHTVCEGARCPNMGTCWGRGVATFMILGDICSRACRFCAVTTGVPAVVDRAEPANIAAAVKNMKLSYVVVTSVTRDDLPDQGAGQFVDTITALRREIPSVHVEVLIPDFSGHEELVASVVTAAPAVMGHNIETVRRLFSSVRPQAEYERSLRVIAFIKKCAPAMITKSGFMVGLGEDEDDIRRTLGDLAGVGCDMVTIGQYLRPVTSARHVPVSRFVTPEEFAQYAAWAREMGFRYVHSGPLVRSSFIAEEGYERVVERMTVDNRP